MLTRDLLRTRQVHDRILPAFIREAAWRERIEEILAVYRAHVGLRHEDLREALMGHTEGGSWEGRVCKGLCQLLEKEIDYADEDSDAFSMRRQACFTQSAELLRGSPPCKIEELFSRLEAILPGRELELYGDLPKLRQIHAVPDLTARQLVRNYNQAMAQGLLAQASRVLIDAPPSCAGMLPAFLRCLKWSGLNFQAERQPGGELRINIACAEDKVVDRPKLYRSLVAQLAELVPHLREFKLGARVDLGEGAGWMVINHGDRLVSSQDMLPSSLSADMRQFLKALDETLRSYGYRPVEPGSLDETGPEALADRHWISSGREILFNAYQANQGEILARHMSRYAGESKTVLAVEKQLVPMLNDRDIPHLVFTKCPSVAAFMKHLSLCQGL